MRNPRYSADILRHIRENQYVGESLADTTFRLMGIKKPGRTRAGGKYNFHKLAYGKVYRYSFKTKIEQDRFKRNLYKFRTAHKINIIHNSVGLETFIKLEDPAKNPYRTYKRAPSK